MTLARGIEIGAYYHWTPEDFAVLTAAETCEAMRDVALHIMRRMPRPIVQVCGPLTTGGRGSYAENIVVLGRAITHIHSAGHHVFDQRPFEEPMERLKVRLPLVDGYPMALLEEFYRPVFASGYVSALHFLPGWESSVGARWEHMEAQRLGLAIEYFPADWEALAWTTP